MSNTQVQKIKNESGIDFVPADKLQNRGEMIDAAIQREAQEVQAQIVSAKRFPRDEDLAVEKIMKACKRRGLAENAVYSYPKGGTTVTGASIRLAEQLARSWGNIEFGVRELEQANGESTMMAFAIDLETNTREAKVFQVKHIRHTKRGDYELTDPREIYELCANNAARLLRSCILSIIPIDIVEDAVAECEKTLLDGDKEPLAQRIDKMTKAFKEYEVTQQMIEARLGHDINATTEHELVNLKKIYASLRDSMTKVEDHFGK